MGKTAIILGATGLTGNLLLNKLITDDRYREVKIFTRKPTGTTHPKVTEIVGNLLELEQYKNEFIADEVYCCIGTTAKKTPDKSLYRKIDFGIPAAAAKLCKKNNIHTFLVVSAMGAHPKSKIFYNKTKGEMELAVFSEKIPNTYILRPSFIGGKRDEKRLGEKMGIAFAKFIQPLLQGRLKKYRLIEAETIAQAMIYLANTKPGIQIVPSDKIQTFGSKTN